MKNNLKLMDFLTVMQDKKGYVMLRSQDKNNYWFELYDDFGKVIATSNELRATELRRLSETTIASIRPNLSRYISLCLEGKVEVF